MSQFVTLITLSNTLVLEDFYLKIKNQNWPKIKYIKNSIIDISLMDKIDIHPLGGSRIRFYDYSDNVELAEYDELDFGPDVHYFNVQFTSLDLLNQIIKLIFHPTIYIETEYNFCINTEKYISILSKNPNWDWRKFKYYEDPLIWKQTSKKCSYKQIDPILPHMQKIPKGSFLMGYSENALRNYAILPMEHPVHEVNIDYSFNIARYPITFSEYQVFCESTGNLTPYDMEWGRENFPIINISYEEAVIYCEWLSALTSRNFRLPSEAEWEYVARLGTPPEYLTNITTNKTFCNRTKNFPVGSFGKNKLGIYDMVDNIWELTQDYRHLNYENAPIDGSAWLEYEDPDDNTYRVVRGGAWLNGSLEYRITKRHFIDYKRKLPSVGFRLIEDI